MNGRIASTHAKAAATPQAAVEAARAYVAAVRRLGLPDDTAVYPTHGFGSFCSSGSATGGSTTGGSSSGGTSAGSASTGGSSTGNDMGGVQYDAAIWNPSTGQWTYMESELMARLYHSTSLLLPDGSILSLGGGGMTKVQLAPGQLERFHNPKSPQDYIARADELPRQKDEIFDLLARIK